MSTQLKPVGDWVDQAFNAIFFHSDDALAIKSFEDHFDPGLLVRLNHDRFTYDQYKEAVKHARSTDIITLDSSEEILKWDDAEKKGGTVAHLTKFTTKNKKTGQETKSTSLILSAVKWVDGKRVITEITEVAV
ncbi:hypothetical protein SLS57_003518 [Botryosphaeria dothidea]